MRRVFFTTALIALISPAPLLAWGARGHRIITLLALDGLPDAAPAWLRDPAVRERIAYQSSEPDRWRGWRSEILQHSHKQDHYLDIELLEQFGLTLETIPRLRTEYLRAMIISKHEHPELVDAYDPKDDPDRTKEWPGALPHGIAEQYAKLQSSFHQLRVLEELKDSRRQAQLEQARANVIYHMGVLSHFVGDAAQPLHTTKHFNGWVGENPEGYTTDKKFHAYIDTGVIERHNLAHENVKPAVRFDARVTAVDPWDDVLAYLRRSFAEVEPLYRLERDGELNAPTGREFICARLADGAAMLSALYWAAYTSAAPNEKQVGDFIRWNEESPAPASAPASQPASPE
jgi:hypothetical protein